MILDVNMLRFVLYLICSELRSLFVEGNEEYLVLLLKLLLYSQMLAAVELSLVPIHYCHSSDLV